jgi:hypothetical protein
VSFDVCGNAEFEHRVLMNSIILHIRLSSRRGPKNKTRQYAVPTADTSPNMSKGNPRTSPTYIFTFATAFLMTDYLLYKLRIKNVNSMVWARVLDSRVDTASQLVGRQ